MKYRDIEILVGELRDIQRFIAVVQVSELQQGRHDALKIPDKSILTSWIEGFIERFENAEFKAL